MSKLAYDSQEKALPVTDARRHAVSQGHGSSNVAVDVAH
jgi:hypothetical protein